MSNPDTAIEMFVVGLVLDPNTQAPVVILKDEKGDLALPIWIGIAEATSIASAIKQVTMARPLTHDLMHDIFGELGVRVQRVVITELKDSTYYAELVLSVGEKALIFDSRPSDAIAIALRAAAPIYVLQEVLDQAKVTFSAVIGEHSHEASGEEKEGEEADSEAGDSEKDFRSLDKDKWAELLEKLNPDDFKYKM
ncbi:MAG: bifunctional nuclease family protein [SAR324 cluster bacterium]|uniref:Bifunctional nuclease family protein n=1 Tax=SAR324 cluster bacterium TaxID=2024889 RepID=A0A7X9FRF7_9DELT|nr:bifunctional nuclease family protein [SAR324 cluster bacterium]